MYSHLRPLSFIRLLLLASLLVSAPAYAALIVVDDDGVECPDPDFATIQEAVDQAALSSARDRIRICPGTYAENVSIGPGNAVMLLGSGAGSTIVTGVAGTAGPIIGAVSAGKVDVRNLTVDGGSAMAGSVVQGIRLEDTGGTLQDLEVLNIRNGDGSSQGLGIRVESTGPVAKVRVLDSLVDNYTRVGINGNGPGATLTAVRNTIRSPSAPTVWAPNGIQVSRGARGRLVRNDVQGPTSPNPPGGAGSGIIIFCASEKTVVAGNVVADSDVAVSVVDTKKSRIVSNDISSSIFDGISVQFLGNFFGDLGCPGHPVSPSGNLVARNRITDSAENGISVVNFDVASDPEAPSDNRIVVNDISNSGSDGIHIFALGGGDNPAGNQVRVNRISTSGATDAVDDTVGGGTAGTANDWKVNDCTTSSPIGLCD